MSTSEYCISELTHSPEYKVAGCLVYGLTIPALNGLVEEYVSEGRRRIIANHNLHSVYLWHQHKNVRDFYSIADCMHVDGMGVVFLAKLLGIRIARDQRVTYVDWVPSLMQLAAERGWRIFYLGSKPEVADLAAKRLRTNYAGLEIETAHGYFDTNGSENDIMLGRIRRFRPNIMMVGMGMPRQEGWILKNIEQLPDAVILTSGAAFDYFAGVIPTPPRWAGRVGLEWLFRLLAEPKRMWKRYLVEPWLLVVLLLRFWAHDATVRSVR